MGTENRQMLASGPDCPQPMASLLTTQPRTLRGRVEKAGLKGRREGWLAAVPRPRSESVSTAAAGTSLANRRQGQSRPGPWAMVNADPLRGFCVELLSFPALLFPLYTQHGSCGHDFLQGLPRARTFWGWRKPCQAWGDAEHPEEGEARLALAREGGSSQKETMR